MSSMTPIRLGLAVAAAVLAADQASKLGLLYGYGIRENGPITLGPNLGIVEVWNRGISYGLFQQDSAFGRWILVGIALIAAILFSLWLNRARTRLAGLSLGLIIGGAFGNAIDRAAYGAVFDFIHFHAGSFSWYVFNVADAAIVVGVAGLMLDSLLPERGKAQGSGTGSGGLPLFRHDSTSGDAGSGRSG
jgi:signal peptidase II